MKQVIRAQYRAAVKNGIAEKEMQKAVLLCGLRMEKEKQGDRLLTGSMFRYKNMLFLYVEHIIDAEEKNKYEVQKDIEQLPELWFSELAPFLHTWTEISGEKNWVYMYPVFWFDMPKSIETWERKEKPDKCCGRIAILYHDKLFSYVCHHQAIVNEGLLIGDRYQCISLHENILFSYFETPREREQVNIKRAAEPSQEIGKWEAADPESHFYHFPEARGENFLVIETLISV